MTDLINRNMKFLQRPYSYICFSLYSMTIKMLVMLCVQIMVFLYKAKERKRSFCPDFYCSGDHVRNAYSSELSASGSFSCSFLCNARFKEFFWRLFIYMD